MNGYMIVDIKNKEIGLVEMSYQSFVYFKSHKNENYKIITKPAGLSTEYDHQMVQPDYIFGYDYPASILIREELQSIETKPAIRRQFLEKIGGVIDIESAKALITYIDPLNPVSIYGRVDLGYGEINPPKTIPGGALDAKAISASQMSYIWDLKGIFDPCAQTPIFWMKFGTPKVNC